MNNVVAIFRNVLKNHKLKILFFTLCFMLSLFMLFPFQDIGDLVSTQIAKFTNNQVYVQFQKPGISLYPGLGLELEDVYIETAMFPPIKAKTLSVNPSLSGLLTFSPGVSIHARESLGGNIDFSIKSSSINSKPAQTFSIYATQLDLGKVVGLSPIPIPVEGKLQLISNGEVDPTFMEDPNGNVQITINNLNLSSESISTPMGPMTLPPLTLNEVTLAGELKDGQLRVEQLQVGDSKDELMAQVKGRLDLKIRNVGGVAEVTLGGYDIELRMQAQTSFQNKAGLFLSFLNSYKKPAGQGVMQYNIKLTGPNFQVPPKITQL